MRFIALLFAVSMIFLSYIPISQGNGKIIILKGKIIKFTKYDESEAADAEGIFQVIEYKVVKVYKGKYKDETIKVAHHVSTARDFNLGDEICIKVKESEALIKFYNDLREAGVNVPKDEDAKYVYIGFNQKFSCDD